MRRQIKIHIHKKTLVPTKHQIKHDERSDWKRAGIIDYHESSQIFFEIGGGPIKTDADFARLLYDNFGSGYYSCIFWRKGMKGFRRFINLICADDGFFVQFKAAVYANRKKKMKKQDYEYVKMVYMETTDFDEKNRLWEELKVLENNLNRDVAEGTYPYPYLQSLQPRYKIHRYNDPYIEREKQVVKKPKTNPEQQKQEIVEEGAWGPIDKSVFYVAPPEEIKQEEGMGAIW